MDVMINSDENANRHPIQVVSRRTGISQDVIRVWERRYHAVTPERSPTNRRLYSDEDVRRLRLLKRATKGGRRIGDVAGLPTNELEQLVHADDEAAVGVSAPGVSGGAGRPATEHLDVCLEAINALDEEALDRELARAAVSLTVPQLLEQLLLPVLQRVGEGWHDGSLRITHEHMTSSVVRSFLGSMRSNSDMAGPRTEILITTPAGQLHELGALMAAVTADLDGWRPVYLGPNMPAEEIAAIVQQREARIVALSIVHVADPSTVTGELRKIHRLVPEGTVLIVGGSGARHYRGVLEEVGAIQVDDLTSFRGELDRLRESEL
jgi:DNA-binding transcriptional MerR regulator/methylmalonyl-CoA mutase cobalamin-binding subunit